MFYILEIVIESEDCSVHSGNLKLTQNVNFFFQLTIPKERTTYWCSLIQLPEFKSKHHITKVSTEVQNIAIKPVFIQLYLIIVK